MSEVPIAERCSNCRWWVAGAPTLAKAARDPSTGPEIGACQVNPPTLLIVLGAATSCFPVTHADRYCGAWEEPVDDGPEDPDRAEADNVLDFKAAA